MHRPRSCSALQHISCSHRTRLGEGWRFQGHTEIVEGPYNVGKAQDGPAREGGTLPLERALGLSLIPAIRELIPIPSARRLDRD